MLLMPSVRFVCVQRQNASAVKQLRLYLKEKKQSVDFEVFTPEQLDEVLGHFYIEARQKNGQLYRGKSLQSLRYALNRYLKAERQLDILNEVQFTQSSELFKVAMAELKAEGKGDVRHYPPITDEDMQKLYSSVYLNPDTPVGLANKVQFDIRLFFFRRGFENMEKMMKSSFEVKTAPNGKKYVTKKKDELTKNHRWNDKTHTESCMPEMDDPKTCPVKSFEKYISKLHPACDRLWQYPRDAFQESDNCWYQNKPMGVNTLQAFLPRLSQNAALSRTYTNHSIRATGATILAQEKFCPADIMAVTGHKSVASLSIYQHTNLSRKMEMAQNIMTHITPSQQLEVSTMPSSSSSHTNPQQQSDTVMADTQKHMQPVSLAETLTRAQSQATGISISRPTLRPTHTRQTLTTVTNSSRQPPNQQTTSNTQLAHRSGFAELDTQDQQLLQDLTFTQSQLDAWMENEPEDITTYNHPNIFSHCNMANATLNITINIHKK